MAATAHGDNSTHHDDGVSNVPPHTHNHTNTLMRKSVKSYPAWTCRQWRARSGGAAANPGGNLFLDGAGRALCRNLDEVVVDGRGPEDALGNRPQQPLGVVDESIQCPARLTEPELVVPNRDDRVVDLQRLGKSRGPAQRVRNVGIVRTKNTIGGPPPG